MFLVPFEENSVVPANRNIIASSGLSGGGSLVGDVTLSVDTAFISTRSYVESLFQARDWKESVRAATTQALPAYTRNGNVITAVANGALPTIDGITLVQGDRMAFAHGAAGADNGLYDVTQVGDGGTPFILTRSNDGNEPDEVTARMAFGVEEGTQKGNWICSNIGAVTLNTTPITLVQVTSGVPLSTNVDDIQPLGVAAIGNSSTSSPSDHVHPMPSASDITSGQLAVAQGGTNLTSYTVGDLIYASGATVLSKLADVATGSLLASGGVATAPAWSATPSVTTLTGSTSLLTPLVDTPTSTTLVLGTTNATAITLQQTTTLAAGKSLSMSAGAGGLSLSNGTGDWAMPTGAGSYLGASTKTLSLQTTAAAITIKSNTSGTVTIDSAGTLLLGTSTATTTSLGRSGTITTLNGTIQVGVGASFTSVSGGYAIDFDFSTSTGGTWLPSGNVNYTGASTKTVSFVTTGSGSSITLTAGAGSTWSTSAGSLTLSGFTAMALQVAGSNIITLASTGATLAAGKSITFTAGAGNLSLGSGTGDSTLTTGAFSWTGASNKALAFTAQGASGTMEIRTGAGTLNIQSSSNDVTVQTISNAALLWLVSGTGRYILNGFDGGSLRYNTTDRWVLRVGSQVFTTGATSGSTTVGYSFTGAAHTTLTASTERNLFLVDLGQTVQFATGALTTQRSILFKAPTYSFAGTSTLTNAATVAIDAAPTAGTNATITNPYALWVQSGTTKLDGRLSLVSDTATGAASAATCNAQVCTITTESLSIAWGSRSAYTITNSYVNSSSRIFVTVENGTNTTNPVIATNVIPGTGSFTVDIWNQNTGSSLNGTVKLHILVL